MIDTTSLFACTSLDSTSLLSFFRLISQKAGSACLKECFFRGPGEGSFDCLEQWGSLAAVAAAANLMSITVKFLMKQYAKYANQRPPLTRLLLLLLLVVDLIAFCHIQRGSCSCSRLALVKVPAHKAKGADGLSRLPSRAGRHINRQLSNGQERNLCSVAGQDGVLLLLDRKCVAVLQRCNLVGPGSA